MDQAAYVVVEGGDGSEVLAVWEAVVADVAEPRADLGFDGFDLW